MTDQENYDEALTKVISVVDELCADYLDSVQIFGTYYDSKTGTTIKVIFGKGNWYSRLGVIREFIEIQKGQILAVEILRTHDKLSDR